MRGIAMVLLGRFFPLGAAIRPLPQSGARAEPPRIGQIARDMADASWARTRLICVRTWTSKAKLITRRILERSRQMVLAIIAGEPGKRGKRLALRKGKLWCSVIPISGRHGCFFAVGREPQRGFDQPGQIATKTGSLYSPKFVVIPILQILV